MDLPDLDRYQNLTVFELQALHSAYMGLAEETASEMTDAADMENEDGVTEAVEENRGAMDKGETLFKLLHAHLTEPDDE